MSYHDVGRPRRLLQYVILQYTMDKSFDQRDIFVLRQFSLRSANLRDFFNITEIVKRCQLYVCTDVFMAC